ncbi:hypothetical protein R1sor_018813 [Riccia sorocarpa]|uniref:Uncharacterized protein n=1 Tax=Riccia sorocarpa TaxID=122646 RepID=A0ABD3IBA1_9MARC
MAAGMAAVGHGIQHAQAGGVLTMAVCKGSCHDQAMGNNFPSCEEIKAILFDVDGTITDSDPLHFQAFKEIFEQGWAEWGQAGFNNGEPMTKEFFLTQISGKLNSVITAEQFPHLDESAREKITEEKEARYRSLAKEHTSEIAGLSKFIEWIKERGLRRAAVSNSPRDNVEQVISALGLDEFFELVVIGHECERPKPFPDPYLKALRFFGVSPEQALIFEDSPAGTKAGAAAGVAVVGLTTGHPEGTLRTAGATLIIKSYEDPALWEKLQGETNSSAKNKTIPDAISQ